MLPQRRGVNNDKAIGKTVGARTCGQNINARISEQLTDTIGKKKAAKSSSFF
jgi:hypothetical protein